MVVQNVSTKFLNVASPKLVATKQGMDKSALLPAAAVAGNGSARGAQATRPARCNRVLPTAC